MKRRGWNKKQTIVAVIIVLIIFATGIILPHYIKEFYKKDVDSKGSLYQLRPTGFPDPYLLPPDYKECTDSDGGRDFYTKGTTVGLAADMVMSTDTDFCRTDLPGYLVEWYCTTITSSDDYAISFRTNTNYECLDGICEDGACTDGSDDIIDGCATSPQAGDLSGDGCVNNEDYAIFADEWGQGCSGDEYSDPLCNEADCWCNGADSNSDGCVDFTDLENLVDHWGEGC